MRFLATVLLLTATLVQAEDRPLRFSVVDSWAMPLAQIENGELTGGIMFELFNEAAHELGRPAAFHIVPRARIEQALLSHAVDVRCYVSRSWIEHEFNDYRWTAPLMVQRDLLVVRDAPADKLETLPSQSVGTVLGYHYPRLQPLLDSHWLTRDDARNQELVLKKLRIGRYQYAISSEFALNWFNRELPEAERLRIASVIEETPLSCMVLDAPDVRTDEVLSVLAKIKASGKIEQILNHYR